MRKTSKLLLITSAFIPLFALFPSRPTKRQKELFFGRNYAHRGLHSRDKIIPENSIRAFKLATQKGYGIELDVQLSKDGQVVVFHDENLSRMCGINGRIDSYTYSQLKRLPLNGSSSDHIPLLSEVLDTVNGNTPLIVELKNCKKNTELCKKTYSLIQQYDGPVCIESFNPFIVNWFRKNAPQILRGQLAACSDEYDTSIALARFILSHCFLNFVARPQFIAYQLTKKPLTIKLMEKLGAMKVCWTSKMRDNEQNNDMVIFEFYRPSPKFK